MAVFEQSLLDVRPEVAAALREGRPVVALESTLIAHGLPWPVNLETAHAAESAIREEGATPATVAVWQGRPTIGLAPLEVDELARSKTALKASRRDLGVAVAQGRTAATTVAATMMLARKAGIRLFATGGIGGAHRLLERASAADAWDISADLIELGRTDVAVVCAGAKSVLDIPRTLEILETHGVPIIGYGTDQFPAFYLRSSGERITARADTPQQTAAILNAHWVLGGAGLIIAQPVAQSVALQPEEFAEALAQAERQAAADRIRGPALTPYLLAVLAELTGGKTIKANQSLVIANAQLAARIAAALAGADGHWIV
ncbi:pseudouridine-5-phosphate glycosidase [Planctomycetaceae bacterium SCGC AG-212-D15]|nr:pseudouridine-5-phosphate glycosidase [Planctomycetaceae bacterium SCGC AG-212-D15]